MIADRKLYKDNPAEWIRKHNEVSAEIVPTGPECLPVALGIAGAAALIIVVVVRKLLASRLRT